jgi:hypothetical protein
VLKGKAVSPSASKVPDELVAAWMSSWPEATAIWSPFLKLQPPEFFRTSRAAANAGLAESFAAIRLADQSVRVDLERITGDGLNGFAVEILAHEIGHHVLAPATFADHLRCLARIRRGLPTLERFAPQIANMYTDLLINDRLQRSHGLSIDGVFRQLNVVSDANRPSSLWTLYLRIMEQLWSLPKGDIGSGPTDDRLEGDAWLYAADWLDGSGRFASLILSYLLGDLDGLAPNQRWADTIAAGTGSVPSGLTVHDAGEIGGNVHPSMDPRINDSLAENDSHSAGINADAVSVASVSVASVSVASGAVGGQGAGQCRPPFEFGELLRAGGVDISEHDAAVLYYRELAQPHLVRFPRVSVPESVEPLAEGTQPWSFGEPLDAVDWFESMMVSPQIIPGLTTVQRVWGTSEGSNETVEPVDLDVYVDSSGSMPNPQVQLSYPALAGAIIAMSALRAGSAVQATLWSGPGDVLTTNGFVRDPQLIMRVLTGYFGGSTQFPLHVLRDTYHPSRTLRRKVHLLQISDSGIDTMYEDTDTPSLEQGWSARTAMHRAGGGGTMALQLFEDLDGVPTPGGDVLPDSIGVIRQMRDRDGWKIFSVTTQEELLNFAQVFSRTHYSPSARALTTPRDRS